MRITELFTAQSIALDEALQTQEQILSRLVELQATHGNITDKDAYKKALYAREAEELGLEVSVQAAKAAAPYADGFYLMTPFNRVALMERLIARLRTEVTD